VRSLFEGVDLIVHAGDVGGPHVLIELEAIAPLVAVRGNTDHGAWAAGLPAPATFRVGGLVGTVVHDLSAAIVPGEARIVISGHTHRPSIERRRDALYLNPGSAAHSRSSNAGESVALVTVDLGQAHARIVAL